MSHRLAQVCATQYEIIYFMYLNSKFEKISNCSIIVLNKNVKKSFEINSNSYLHLLIMFEKEHCT